LNRPDPLPVFHLYNSENLVSTVDGNVHQQRRKPLRTLYTKRVVDSEQMQGLISKIMQRFDANLDKSMGSHGSGLVDIRSLFQWMLCDIMSHIVYGQEHALNLFENLEDRAAMQVDFKWQDERLLTFDTILSALIPSLLVSIRKSTLAPKFLALSFPENLHMRKVAAIALQDVLEGCNGSKTRGESLLEQLVDHFRENGPSQACPDLNYILSECMDHFWAGVNTTADALSAIIYELSLPTNRDRQRRLREALHQTGLASGEVPTTSSASGSLDYLHCVIRESLRLHPPISISLERQVTAREGSIDVAGHTLPAGTTVSAQAYSVHRNPLAFPDPEAWLPERWDLDHSSDQYKLLKRHSFAFGAGPRMCIGMNVAETVIQHCVGVIYRNFETSLGDEWFDAKGHLLGEDARKTKGLWPKWFGGGRVPLVLRKL
jgi:cytochrome P450